MITPTPNFIIDFAAQFCNHISSFMSSHLEQEMTEDTVSQNAENTELMRMSVKIAVAYLNNNTIQAAEIPGVISLIYDSLNKLSGNSGEIQSEPPKPAVPIKKSIQNDYIICLEDGKQLKMLKRHLRTTYNMSPEEYRAKWGLSPDYPMVAPAYAAQRSAFAKKIGLGRSNSKRRGRAK